MPNPIKAPRISKELITYLDRLFPNQCAELDQDEKEIFYKSGQRSVVNHLMEKRKIQKEN